MPGTIIFKPIEANLNHSGDLLTKADPYCQFIVDGQKIKSQASKSGGKHPIWEDTITIPASTQPTCLVELKDKDILRDDKLGTFEIDLREIESQGRLKKWYPIFLKDRPAGEILMEAMVAPHGSQGMGMSSQGMGMGTGMGTGMAMGTGMGMTSGMPMHTTGTTMHSQGMGTGMGTGVPMYTTGTSMQSQGMMGAPMTHTTTVHPTEHIIPGGAPLMGQGTMGQGMMGQGMMGQGMTGQSMMQSGGMQPNSGLSNYGGALGGGMDDLSEQYALEALLNSVAPMGSMPRSMGSMGMSGGPGLHNLLPQSMPMGGSNMTSQLPGQNIPGQLIGQSLPGQQVMGGQHLPGQQVMGGQHLPGQQVMGGQYLPGQGIGQTMQQHLPGGSHLPGQNIQPNQF